MVNGQNLAVLRRSAIPYLRRHFGMVFQDQKLLFDRSVLDNVLLPLQIAGLRGARRSAAPGQRSTRSAPPAREKATPIALSGGEQQRLAIARAVVNRPAVLLADEPTGNLDIDSANGSPDLCRLPPGRRHGRRRYPRPALDRALPPECPVPRSREDSGMTLPSVGHAGRAGGQHPARGRAHPRPASPVGAAAHGSGWPPGTPGSPNIGRRLFAAVRRLWAAPLNTLLSLLVIGIVLTCPPSVTCC